MMGLIVQICHFEVLWKDLNFSLLFLFGPLGVVVPALQVEKIKLPSGCQVPWLDSERSVPKYFSLSLSLLVNVKGATCVETYFYRKMRKPEVG